jgi:hypothetical protein
MQIEQIPSLYSTSCVTASVVWWSELLATDPDVRVPFPGEVADLS